MKEARGGRVSTTHQAAGFIRPSWQASRASSPPPPARRLPPSIQMSVQARRDLPEPKGSSVSRGPGPWITHQQGVTGGLRAHLGPRESREKKVWRWLRRRGLPVFGRQCLHWSPRGALLHHKRRQQTLWCVRISHPDSRNPSHLRKVIAWTTPGRRSTKPAG